MFQKLLIDSAFPIEIDILSISTLNFERYCSNTITIPNKHWIVSLHLSNLFLINVCFITTTFSERKT